MQGEKEKEKSGWAVVLPGVIPPVGDFTVLNLTLECATAQNQGETWSQNQKECNHLTLEIGEDTRRSGCFELNSPSWASN